MKTKKLDPIAWLIGGNGIRVSILLLFLFCLVAFVIVPTVFSFSNIANVLRVYSPAGIMAMGLTLVLILGEIDVSVGSIMSLSIMVSARLLAVNQTFAIVALLITGAICGFINGVIVAKIKVPSLMATIGTSLFYGGLASIIVNGQSIYITAEHVIFTRLAKGYTLGMPTNFVICLVVAICCWYLSSKTQFGKNIYYIGANKRAAYMSGIDIVKQKIIVYTICGTLAAAAGPLIATQIGRAKSDLGTGYEVTAIAICVLGGTLIDGGKGSPIGVLCGMLTMGLMMNTLALSGLGTYVEMALKGILIILVVLIYENANKYSMRSSASSRTAKTVS